MPVQIHLHCAPQEARDNIPTSLQQESNFLDSCARLICSVTVRSPPILWSRSRPSASNTGCRWQDITNATCLIIMSHQSSYLDGSTYHRKYPYDDQHPQFSFSTLLAYITLSVALIYYIVINLGSSPSSVFDSLWGLLVYITPYRLITALQSSSVTYAGIGNDQPGDENKMQRRAAKSEALRSFLGFNGDGVLARLCHSTASLEPKGAQRPPGLGNWDNSCYQNSVIQVGNNRPSRFTIASSEERV